MKNLFYLLIVIIQFPIKAIADEGMWLPLLLDKYNIADMQSKGCKLSAEDIYSINNSSLKDAVVLFGGGCTGEFISAEGLLITNHHCGIGAIQSHSSIENNYISNGFWARNKSEELTNPSLKVSILVRMEDVTSQVLSGINDKISESIRKQLIDSASIQIAQKAIQGTKYEAIVKPLFAGNEYYLFVYEVFRDVRLVGAPPISIGNFGGDTDNWIWPRHTGDFSIFRVYANKNNEPAPYSSDNVPYKPKKFLSISLKGINEGDFTMVYGFPGTTYQNMTSFGIKNVTQVSNVHKIELRTRQLDIIKRYMINNPQVRIMYTSKQADISNAWKKWMGINRGIERLKVIQEKEQFENLFYNWVNTNPELKQKYGDLLERYENTYKSLAPYQVALDYYNEAILGIESVEFAQNFYKLYSLCKQDKSINDINDEVLSLKSKAKKFYKDYYQPIDRELFMTLLEMYYKNVDKTYHPEFFTEIIKKYKGNYWEYANYVYKKSIFTDSIKLNNFLNSFTTSSYLKLEKDPIFYIIKETINIMNTKVINKFNELVDSLSELNRLYVAAICEMQPDKIKYPDANLTLRLAYGNVKGYNPANGIRYKYYTTLNGLFEKEDTTIHDYKVPQKLKELYKAKDFGKYAQNDTIRIAFIATNHTSGGNSGSPVLDAYGNLIGINFDRCWEGTMSDFKYDISLCRNISVDIRYVLFIIDKYAGATNIIDELTIVN